MELTVETYRVERVWWEAYLDFGQSDSSSFTIAEVNWNFQLTRSESSETWYLDLIRNGETSLPAKFVVTTYLKSEDNQLFFIVSKVITMSRTQIWIISMQDLPEGYLRTKIPDGFCLSLKFCFIFHCLNQEPEHKSVQTSSYMDDRLCQESLSEDFCKLMDENPSPDVQLKCGARTFPAHRLILSARSEMFRAMLQSDMLENREGSVEVPDMEPDVFEVFLRYFYTGALPELTVDTALELYEAGDKYRLEALMRRCGDFLAENLTPDNARGILVVADAHNDKKLKDVALSYILDKNIPDKDAYWLEFSDEHQSIPSSE